MVWRPGVSDSPNSYEEAADFADVHFLAVGTPQNKRDSGADLSYIDAAIDALCPHLNRPTLIVGKSTVPVERPSGWQERPAVAACRRRGRVGVEPRISQEASACRAPYHPDRIVVGLENRQDSPVRGSCRNICALLDDDIPFW